MKNFIYCKIKYTGHLNQTDNKNADLIPTKNLKNNKDEGLFLTNQENKSDQNAEEVKRRIEEYKNQLNEELNKIIQEEKEKEDERMKKYTEEAEEEIKKILEEAIVKERKASSRRVVLFNE